MKIVNITKRQVLKAILCTKKLAREKSVLKLCYLSYSQLCLITI